MSNTKTNEKIRNIAIIAHVDHGKTTLVDQLFRQSGVFRSNQDVSDRVMDNMDLEKERGITIAAKNCSILWKDTRINIIDTPGHADFGGEVERALMMVDGAILLVDSAEGPLPQTRFVLRKALEAGKKIIVVVNKIDREDARPKEVLDQIYELFLDLDAGDDQIDFPVLYAIGRQGIAKKELTDEASDLTVLFDAIINDLPPPSYNPAEPFQMLVLNLAYSDYLGRLAIGRVMNGFAKKNDALVRIGEGDKTEALRVSKLQSYEGIKIVEIEEAHPGEIVILAGIDEVKIGDTICNQLNPKALKRVVVDEPTISMQFKVNNSPFSGREGDYVQGPRIYERLKKEELYNVAIRVDGSAESDTFVVKGRGEFQMAIIIETMRREGFELLVGRPEIILKEVDGKQLEPVENVTIDCEERFIGIVNEKLYIRKGKLQNLVNHGTGRVRIEFSVPSRGLIGYRNEFLTDTRGTGMISSYLAGYEEFRGEFESRKTGSLVSDREGEAVAYGLFGLEPRGHLMVGHGSAVYAGMIIGEHNRDNDLYVNPCRSKKLTNIRSAGRDENIILTPISPLTLEKAIEFIKSDELVEVTPQNIRMRKAKLPAASRG